MSVEHFIDIVPLKFTDAVTINIALVECLKKKSIKFGASWEAIQIKGTDR